MGSPLPEDEWEKASYRFKFGRDYPVIYVSLHQALAFCKQLTQQERLAGRLPDTEEYSLPTEAEWEYACRAGTTTKYSFGSDDNELTQYAWYRINASDANKNFAHRVATKKPNPWGIYDMHGNVNEWCLDAFCKRCPGGKDPIVTKEEEGWQRYVYRGGNWNSHMCHSAHRNANRSETRFNDIGFRPVRTLVRKLPDNFPAQAEPECKGETKVSAGNGTAACRARVYGGHRGRAISAVLIFGGLVSVDSWEAGMAGVGAHGETSPVRGRGEAGVSVAGVSVAGGVAVTLATVGL